MALYEFYGVTKAYAGQTVLNIPELVLEEGKTSCLLGPNGSGKTTLLELLAFLTKPTSGRMVYRSRPVNHSTPRLQLLRREVVLVEQHPILFSTSVFHNVEFGLRARKIDSSKRRRVVEESLDLVGMSDFINVRRHRLSGGETQRLAIARALACMPRVILFDEPTASVDLENQIAIERIIREVVEEKRTTVVFTTHGQDQAFRLADNRIFLLGGRPVGSEYHNLFNGCIVSSADGAKRFMVNGGLSLLIDGGRTGPARASIDPRKLRIRMHEKALSAPPVKRDESLSNLNVAPPDLLAGLDGVEYALGRLVQLAENRSLGARASPPALEKEEVRVVVDVSVPDPWERGRPRPLLNVLIGKQELKRMPLQIGDPVLLQFLPGAVKLLENDIESGRGRPRSQGY